MSKSGDLSDFGFAWARTKQRLRERIGRAPFVKYVDLRLCRAVGNLSIGDV
jgi:hypothetical protein